MASFESGQESVVDRPGEHWRVPTHAEQYESGRFDNLKGHLYRWLEESAIQKALAGLAPGSTVLDAACGTGRVTTLLRRKGFRPSGYDISPAMIAVARRQLDSLGYSEVPLASGDARHLPYPDRSFDAVTCVGLLMHLDAEARVDVLQQLARVARGRMVVQYGYIHPFNRVRERMTGQVPGNVRYSVGEEELQGDLQRAGLAERARFWALRGVSSSVILLLTTSEAGGRPV